VKSLGRAIAWVPHVVVTVLMIVAMVDMLAGVFLRYVMTWASARFDLPSIRFFWVEEIGEYALAWLTFIGAAIGIRRGTHFARSWPATTSCWPGSARWWRSTGGR
jgi:TRAP-type C4-dicarboxylate transport system permease small subunit